MTHDKVDDLVARMLTCATFIRSTLIEGSTPTQHLLEDAATLLTQGADRLLELQPAEQLGHDEALELITPWVDQPPNMSTFTDPGVPAMRKSPGVRPNACPSCDSRATKTVWRMARGFELECPVCSHRWPYISKDKAEWR
jgi:hypothetical protein